MSSFNMTYSYTIPTVKSHNMYDFKIDKENAKTCADTIRMYKNLVIALPAFHGHEEDLFFAGGCIESLWHSQTPNDLDLFVKTPDANFSIKSKLRPKDISLEHTYKDALYLNVPLLGIKINLVFMYSKSPRETIENFDMLHTINYFDFADKKLYLNSKSVWCIENHIMMPRSPQSKVSKKRIDKFVSRGWKNEVPAGNRT